MNKIFVIGLPRTGTTSISVTFLGHGFKVAHTAFTKRAFELADVVSDAPCFSDYKELDQLFPGSKFVYLDRSFESWTPSITMLLNKMQAELHEKTGYLHPILKRTFNQTFLLSSVAGALTSNHLENCYLNHQREVFSYFHRRNDLLKINISQNGSLAILLKFLEIHTESDHNFPKLNSGKQVDYWKSYKHPNKINSLSAGKDHKQFFDYQK